MTGWTISMSARLATTASSRASAARQAMSDGCSTESSKTNSKTSTSVPLPTSPPPSKRVGNPGPGPKPGSRVSREAQRSLIQSEGFEMPSLHFLAEPKNVKRDASLSKDALEQNARLLEGVLEDFGVKGEIIQVRPGPVVTLYELEPAPGIKSSRVIGLADDIARSMSAIACRVAVGRFVMPSASSFPIPRARRFTCANCWPAAISRPPRPNWPWRWASPSMARR